MKKIFAIAIALLFITAFAYAQIGPAGSPPVSPAIKPFLGANPANWAGAPLGASPGNTANYATGNPVLGQRVFVRVDVQEYLETQWNSQNVGPVTITTPGQQVQAGFQRLYMLYSNNTFWTYWYAEMLHRPEVNAGATATLTRMDTLATEYLMRLIFVGDNGLDNGWFATLTGLGAYNGNNVVCHANSWLNPGGYTGGVNSIHGLTKGFLYNANHLHGGSATAMVPHYGKVYLDFTAFAQSAPVAQANDTNHDDSDDAGQYSATVFFVSGVYAMPMY